MLKLLSSEHPTVIETRPSETAIIQITCQASIKLHHLAYDKEYNCSSYRCFCYCSSSGEPRAPTGLAMPQSAPVPAPAQDPLGPGTAARGTTGHQTSLRLFPPGFPDHHTRPGFAGELRPPAQRSVSGGRAAFQHRCCGSGRHPGSAGRSDALVDGVKRDPGRHNEALADFSRGSALLH